MAANPAKRPPRDTIAAAKGLIAALALAATLGGWAALSRAAPPEAPAQPAPLALEVAPIPTLVPQARPPDAPLAQAAPQPRRRAPIVITRSSR